MDPVKTYTAPPCKYTALMINQRFQFVKAVFKVSFSCFFTSKRGLLRFDLMLFTSKLLMVAYHLI